MSTCRKQKSESTIESHPTSSADGCESLACERHQESQAAGPFPKDLSPNGPAGESEPTTTFGTGIGLWPCWNSGKAESYTVRESGNIGQEIVNGDGNVTTWTVDAWLVHVIVRMFEIADLGGLLR